ncbi:MAG: carbohydrate ABC transporter permease [Chloroflexi bacterium]|nr:carbohydrate ABC transporter permease [Chloroflexota bacterium]
MRTAAATHAPSVQAPTWRQNRYVRQRIAHTLLHIVLLIGSIAALGPLIWVLSTSLKVEGTEFVFPPQWIPATFEWQNYVTAMTAVPFALYLRNTLFIVVVTTIGALTTGSLAAFAFARLRFRLRGVLFSLVLSTLMVPYVVTLIPTFIIFKDLNWVNTYWPLILPSWFGGGAFNIFLLRQFFMTLPVELDEAARADGAGAFWIWWNIALPLSAPALATVAIFSVIFHWNDFLNPLIYINSPSLFTLALGLQQFQSQYNTQFTLLMAASVVMILPIIALFFFTQRYFLQGIALTGLAGR